MLWDSGRNLMHSNPLLYLHSTPWKRYFYLRYCYIYFQYHNRILPGLSACNVLQIGSLFLFIRSFGVLSFDLLFNLHLSSSDCRAFSGPHGFKERIRHTLKPYRLQRALVSWFSLTPVSVFNGFLGAFADTGHTVGTLIFPERLAVL